MPAAQGERRWRPRAGTHVIFTWVGQERLTLRAVSRRLAQRGVPSPTGKPRWPSATIAFLLQNTTYKGEALYGKTRVVPRRPCLRPRRGQPEVPRLTYSISRTDTTPIAIPVAALVSDQLFAAAAEQLAENRQRARARRPPAPFLLTGLVVCRHCGYAWHGSGSAARAAGGRARYRYYRCAGTGLPDDTGAPLCRARGLRATELEAEVWADVCKLLREPARVEQEYERRLRGALAEGGGAGEGLARRIAALKRTVSRLIDSYSDGLLERAEFEPRLRAARERLARLEAEAAAQAEEASRRAGLRLVIGKLQEFAALVQSGLESADLEKRREIVRAVVKHLEVDDTEVRIVYRVPPVPFVDRPGGGGLQHCPRDRHHFPHFPTSFRGLRGGLRRRPQGPTGPRAARWRLASHKS